MSYYPRPMLLWDRWYRLSLLKAKADKMRTVAKQLSLFDNT